MPGLIATTSDIKTLSLGRKLDCSLAGPIILVIPAMDGDFCKMDLTGIDREESLCEHGLGQSLVQMFNIYTTII